MRKTPDIMFVLSILAVLGVGITTAVQAQASEEEFIGSKMYQTEKYRINLDPAEAWSLAKMAFAEGVTRDEKDSWLPSYRETYSFNVQLGITFQGEPYDVSLGSAKVYAPVVSNELDESEGLRYGFVGVVLGW
jgi:hypothetical protein